MKVLLDTCVWGGVLPELRKAGIDVIWAGEWARDPGDEEILSIAHKQSRIIITLDKDFGEMAILRNMPHSGIVRLVDLSSKMQVTACLRVLRNYETELAAGAILTVSSDRVRIRSNS